MNQFFNIFKIVFHLLNVLLIFFYLFPGSILGWLFYGDLNKQPSLTKDFFYISSNHFYAFLIFSFFRILSYLKHKKLNLLIYYLLLLSVVLELFHLFLPQRSFQFEDLFGNVLGVVFVLLIYKIWRISL